MKCTAIKLSSRVETPSWKPELNDILKIEEKWTTKGYHGYSYKLSRSRHYSNCHNHNHHHHHHQRERQRQLNQPHLAIMTLTLPEGNTFNTGSSLERWSRKTPQFSNDKHNGLSYDNTIFDDDYDCTYSIENIITSGRYKDSNSNNNDKQKNGSEGGNATLENKEQFKVKVEHAVNKTRKKTNAKSKMMKKTIKFSLSKPVSPQTEQIIRVDVTSNISYDELSQLSNSNLIVYDRHKNDSNRKDIDNVSTGKSLDNTNITNHFIVKCKPLTISDKII